jgi:hypothetical protein
MVMIKLQYLITFWLLATGMCFAQAPSNVSNAKLTHDLTVGGNHDIHLKSGQAVQVLNHLANAVVIMVALPDGSHGVYQATPNDVTGDDSGAAASTTTAYGTIAPTTEDAPTLAQIGNLPGRLSLVNAVTPQNLDVQTGANEQLQIDPLPPGTVLTPVDVQGESVVVLIHARITTGQLVDPNWSNTRLDVTSVPRTVTHTRSVTGKGLVPLRDTNYSLLLSEQRKKLMVSTNDVPAPRTRSSFVAPESSFPATVEKLTPAQPIYFVASASSTNIVSDDAIATPPTQFEKDILANYTPEEIRSHQMTGRDGDFLYPTFSDDFPKTSSSEGKTSMETVQFINHKLQNFTLLYYDANWKTFVAGQIVFTASGRIRLVKFPIALFEPADMNPEKVEKSPQDYGGDVVSINTTNNKKAVTSVPLSGDTVLHGTGVNFPVSDDDADSVGRALVHLIKLYGGRSEDF